MKTKALRTNGLLLIIALVVALFLCEGFLRVVGYRPTISDPKIYCARDNEQWPYGLQPGYQGYYLGKRVTIDKDGNRIVIGGGQVRRGKRRTVLLIGDSLIFGHGVGDGQTIASRLQIKSNEQGLGYQVHNIGAPGYTSWNEYYAFKDYLSRSRPDVVFVLYVPNDVSFDNNQIRLGKGRQPLIADKLFHQVTQVVYRHVYSAFLIREGYHKVRSFFRGKQGGDERLRYLDDEALAYSLEAIEKIKQLCQERDILFAVGVYRDVWHFFDRELSTKYEEKLKKQLAKREILYFTVSRHIDTLSLKEVRVFWNDPHPGPRAIECIVQDIMEELR